MKELIERLTIAVSENMDDCSLCSRMKQLYDDWKPETDEGKLYKRQLGDAIDEMEAEDD